LSCSIGFGLHGIDPEAYRKDAVRKPHRVQLAWMPDHFEFDYIQK
jgi:hypothetical protein